MKHRYKRTDPILTFLIAELFCPHVSPLLDNIV
jgi:hypothetical protein